VTIRTTLLTATMAVVAATSVALGGWAWARDTSGEQEHPTAPQLIEALNDEWNQEQDAILADGVITLEEYNRTTDVVAVCLQRLGLTVHRDVGAGPGGADQLWTESQHDPGDAFLACYERHQGKLSMVWAEQNRPTPDQVAAHAADVNACLVAKGVEPGTVDQHWEDEDGRWAYMLCLDEVPRPDAVNP
jgi:hypothetical protein